MKYLKIKLTLLFQKKKKWRKKHFTIVNINDPSLSIRMHVNIKTFNNNQRVKWNVCAPLRGINIIQIAIYIVSFGIVSLSLIK